jgi:hypothetical protein
VQLGIGLGHHLGDATRLDDRVALQAQSRKQRRIGLFAGQRTRRDEVDLALDPAVEHEIAVGE